MTCQACKDAAKVCELQVVLSTDRILCVDTMMHCAAAIRAACKHQPQGDAPMTNYMALVEEFRNSHKGPGHRCDKCEQNQPCDTIRASDAIEALAKRSDRAEGLLREILSASDEVRSFISKSQCRDADNVSAVRALLDELDQPQGDALNSAESSTPPRSK